MIKKYEGFLDLFKKKSKDKYLDKPIRNRVNGDKIIELIDDSFIELVDNGYTVKNNYFYESYVQITKHNGIRKNRDIMYRFLDVKDNVLSFCDRLKQYDINIDFGFVYENDKGGLSILKPTYEELDGGLYDNREVCILTLHLII